MCCAACGSASRRHDTSAGSADRLAHPPRCPLRRRTMSRRSTRARWCGSWSASASARATTSTRGCWPATCRNTFPGNPSVIVQNQPGAGSLSMTNQLYAAGPFDGTAIGASFNGLPTTPLLQPAGARFEAVKNNWVGSTNRETQAMYVWHAVADPDAGRAHQQGDDRRCAGARLDAIRLSETGGEAVRLEVQGHHRLRGASEDLSGDGAREVHGTWANWSTLKAIRECVDRGKENPHPGAMGAAQASGIAGRAAHSRSGENRPSRSRRSTWRWRGSNSAGRSSCRRTCRQSVSAPSAARSMRR